MKDFEAKCIVLSQRNQNSLVQQTKALDRPRFFGSYLEVISSNVMPENECLAFSNIKTAHDFIGMAEVLGYEKAKCIYMKTQELK